MLWGAGITDDIYYSYCKPPEGYVLYNNTDQWLCVKKGTTGTSNFYRNSSRHEAVAKAYKEQKQETKEAKLNNPDNWKVVE